jgi:hypothetical protein
MNKSTLDKLKRKVRENELERKAKPREKKWRERRWNRFD